MEVTENSEEVEQSNEKERLKMRIAVLEESVRSSEVECKASREMVLRLVAELDRERKKAASSAAALDSLKVELDDLAVGRKSVEMDKDTLMEMLEASKRVTEAAKRESNCLEKQVEELERKLVSSQGETQAAEDKLKMFLKNVADLLWAKSENVIPPTEKNILQKLDKTVSEMQTRLCCVSEELREQAELQHGTLQRAKLAEQQVQDLRERLQSLETELMTADMRRDGLRQSKQQYEEFLEQLSSTMMVDSVALDLGFDMRLKLILSRAEQLVKREGAALMESKNLTYNLQRKLKSQKDQLESKGLHVQFLRKKVSELEEEKRCRSALERDDAHLEAKRMQKKLERLQSELKATKQSNTELKAQLSHTNELKLKVMEQSQSMQEQKKKLEQLAEGKAKAENTLSSVSWDLQSREKQTQEDQQQLSSLRQSLVLLSDRERELEDFRMVVSQMLGYDATALTLPNNEIIKLLELLIHNHHHHHHLHHHVKVPWLCPTHQRPHHLHQIQDSCSLDVSTSRSAHPDDAVTL
ncbi:hypothetical protein JOB18_025613 [Solea senegalensis]|uniref:Coiled-coil domain-containing protein 170 n=1 Tax=Solea senegalensis TaxID=28829 RepID=A0AAV6RYF8_SOLSE|nr:coiled-coil domain-containing protein 170 [Solea senegalensis]KAG7510573.1 hypothetical protein JOB18_025613 [Solea senegalensis]